MGLGELGYVGRWRGMGHTVSLLDCGFVSTDDDGASFEGVGISPFERNWVDARLAGVCSEDDLGSHLFRWCGGLLRLLIDVVNGLIGGSDNGFFSCHLACLQS